MRIHSTKVGCSVEKSVQRNAADSPKSCQQHVASGASQGRKSEGGSGQVNNHSVAAPTALEDTSNEVPRRERIRFPRASDVLEWKSLNDELAKELNARVKGQEVSKKIRLFTDIVYTSCVQRYGTVTPRTGGASHQPPVSRRQREIRELRGEKNKLRSKWRKCQNAHEREGLKAIYESLKARSRVLMRAENTLRKRREKRKARQEFLKQPFAFAKKLFEAPKSGRLEVGKEVLEEHLRKTYCDAHREVPLVPMSDFKVLGPPKVPFNTKPPTLKEVQDVVFKARNGSAPGPNGVPYLVYKKCPQVLHHLHRLLVSAWRQRVVPDEWSRAEGVYIPKEKDSSGISQFRPISLLNVEGKVFFAVAASRLTNFVLKNECVDSAVQKGGIPGIPGCLEHATMIWESIQRAKAQQQELHVIWLDLANAYGAVPHSLLWLALERCNVPTAIVTILKGYFSKFQMRFTTHEYTTRWIDLQVGIAMGCSISPILFVLAMQVLLESAKTPGPPGAAADSVLGMHMPPLKAFMDDTTVITQSVGAARELLAKLDSATSWCRMQFKPTKSRSLSLSHGKLAEGVVFTVGGERIPTVAEEPVKSLGRWYDCSLGDTGRTKELQRYVAEGLAKIDGAKLLGKFKVWILEFLFIPKLLWPLLIYDIPLTTVEALEKTVNKFTRIWLGLPVSLTTVALYSRTAKLRLPLKSLSEEYKVGKARLQLMLNHSNDKGVRDTGVQLRTGRKWKVAEEVSKAQQAVMHRDVVGATQTGTQGLDRVLDMKRWWKKAGVRERRELILTEISSNVEKERVSRAVQQGQQGQWATWESAMQRSLTWNDVWHMAPLRLYFLIRSVYDQLPTGVNLVRWKRTTDPSCPLCGAEQTLKHVLSVCPIALTRGRYLWRHNQVLKRLLEAVDVARLGANRPNRSDDEVTRLGPRFVRAGTVVTKAPPKSLPLRGILSKARDWSLAADLEGARREYPRVVKDTGLRPDIVLMSESKKSLVLIELSVPFESNMDWRHEDKLAKYEDLKAELRPAGWHVDLFAVEVGARGLAGKSAYNLLQALGLSGQMKTRFMKGLAEAAEKASCWIWTKRNDQVWDPCPSAHSPNEEQG